MTIYEPKTANRVVNEIVAALILRLLLHSLSETSYDVEHIYRERLKVLGCNPAYIDSAAATSPPAYTKGTLVRWWATPESGGMLLMPPLSGLLLLLLISPLGASGPLTETTAALPFHLSDR